MNLDHVATYLTVLRTGSFHGAARERGISQASVSQHVRALEEKQGAALVVCDRAGCRPIPGTEPFARHAAVLVELARRASQELVRPTLCVGASSNIGTYLLLPAFRTFTDDHPDIDAKLTVSSNGDIAEQLTENAVDVALLEWWDDRIGLTAVPWREEELVVIVGTEHRWRDRRSVSIDELAGELILGGEPQTGTGERGRGGRL